MSQETGLMAKLTEQVPTFKQLALINGIAPEKAEAIVIQEVEFIRESALANPDIMKCAPQTVLFVVKRAIKNNLTLDPQAGLMYLKTRNVNVSTDPNQPQWVKVLEAQETCNGILSKCRMTGRIIDHKLPQVEFNEAGKCVGVTFEFQLPNGRWETAKFTEYDFERWGNASHKERSRGKQDANTKDYRNVLYTAWRGGIDPEMAKAKAIRHGLKKLGTNPNENKASAIQSAPMQLLPQVTAENEAKEVIEELAENSTSAQVHVTLHEIVDIKSNGEQSNNNTNPTKLPFE
jgi:hypothetical protein